MRICRLGINKNRLSRIARFCAPVWGAALLLCSCAGHVAPAWVEEALAQAEAQSLAMARTIEQMPGQLPRSLSPEGELVTSGSDWWCSGFYPGVLWLLYGDRGNDELKRYAAEFTGRLHDEQYNTTTHDLGFMLFCSYGNAYLQTHEDSCRTALINGARSLATRFNPTVGCIQSWEGWDEWRFPVIIDNMMNLEMLMWAYKQTGDTLFRHVAVTHADKTMRCHFRSDYSSYHVVSYSPETGEVDFRRTNQGCADESAWARGQAWALYGYTMMYRETGYTRYLEQAHHIARFLLDHPRLPEDKIPYWDFDSPSIPDDFRDSSSAAVMASALLELSRYSDTGTAEEYYAVAERQLRTLASPEYTAEYGTNGGFILKHGVGNVPQDSEIDAPLSYGDYYYIEALLRYKHYSAK